MTNITSSPEPVGQPVTLIRCTWATSELGILYHDQEWGVPVHDDRTLFEFIILEGAQAGDHRSQVEQVQAVHSLEKLQAATELMQLGSDRPLGCPLERGRCSHI